MIKQSDIDFLVDRQMRSGTVNFTEKRDTGASSNSIVAIAYGRQRLEDQVLPGDWADLRACRRMWKKLPDHRKTDLAKQAMMRAEREIEDQRANRA